jgi:hypothetical protein
MEKVYLTPKPMRVRTHHPPTYENRFFAPVLSKTGHITLKAVLKQSYSITEKS